MTAISQGDIRPIPLALVTLSETTSQIERRKPPRRDAHAS